MTKEEIIKLLESKGIPVGKWGSGEQKSVQSPIVEKQKENLQKLLVLLEKQVSNDVKTISELHVSLQKIRGRKDVK